MNRVMLPVPYHVLPYPYNNGNQNSSENQETHDRHNDTFNQIYACT